jgi:hypothetical protein
MDTSKINVDAGGVEGHEGSRRRMIVMMLRRGRRRRRRCKDMVCDEGCYLDPLC